MNYKQIQEKILEHFPEGDFLMKDVETKFKELGYKGFLGILPVGIGSIVVALYGLEDLQLVVSRPVNPLAPGRRFYCVSSSNETTPEGDTL